MHSESLKASEALSAQGATHPRVSLSDIEARVAEVFYLNAGEAVRRFYSFPATASATAEPLDVLTICIIVMENGFSVIGKSAPASPENFDPDKGKTFAREDAIRQLWPLEGYALRDRLMKLPDYSHLDRPVGSRIIPADAPIDA